MTTVKLENLTEFSEIPGYSSLNPNEQRAVRLTVQAAKGAKLNSEQKIKVDSVRTKEDANPGKVLEVLHQIGDIQIRTKADEETGRTVITAIPDVTLNAARQAPIKSTGSTFTGGTDFTDLFNDLFGTKR